MYVLKTWLTYGLKHWDVALLLLMGGLLSVMLFVTLNPGPVLKLELVDLPGGVPLNPVCAVVAESLEKFNPQEAIVERVESSGGDYDIASLPALRRVTTELSEGQGGSSSLNSGFRASKKRKKTKGMQRKRKYVSSVAKPRAVNVNNASASELTHLPGVGPALARRILVYRAAHGAFQQVGDLIKVKGIGRKKVMKFRRYVLLR